MKNIIFVFLLVLVSCNSEKKEKSSPFTANGVYTACENTKGYSARNVVTLNDYTLNEFFTIYTSSDCMPGNELIYHNGTYGLERQGYDFILTVKSYYVLPINSYGTSRLNSEGFCNLHWITNTPRSIVGEYCEGIFLKENLKSKVKVSATGGYLTLIKENKKVNFQSLGGLDYRSQTGGINPGEYFYNDGDVSYYVEIISGNNYKVSSYNLISQLKMTESGTVANQGNKIIFTRTSGVDPCGDDDSITEHLFKQTSYTFSMKNKSNGGEEMDIIFGGTPLDKDSFESLVLRKTFTEGCPF